jgi:predicted dithiol-disulfide oxidoreductase (DUF899 family)
VARRVKKRLAHEKELTGHYDRVNAERRRLPMVEIEKDHVFDGHNGKPSLRDLFEGCRQLAVMAAATGHPVLMEGEARGVEALTDANRLRDTTPYGRQQGFEDSPLGWPQKPTYG